MFAMDNHRSQISDVFYGHPQINFYSYALSPLPITIKNAEQVYSNDKKIILIIWR